jgi:hypothetical protein
MATLGQEAALDGCQQCLGTEWPPPEPLIKIASPSSMSCAAWSPLFSMIVFVMPLLAVQRTDPDGLCHPVLNELD